MAALTVIIGEVVAGEGAIPGNVSHALPHNAVQYILLHCTIY